MKEKEIKRISFTGVVEFGSKGRVHRGDLKADDLAKYLAEATQEYVDRHTGGHAYVEFTQVEADYSKRIGESASYEVNLRPKPMPKRRAAKKKAALSLVPKTGTTGD